MKGRISPVLEQILKDPEASRQLRLVLSSDKTGFVTVGGVTYRVERGGSVREEENHKTETGQNSP